MDKQSFVNYIKTLNLNPEIEQAVMGYIENHEFGDKMVDDVAMILETAADQSDMAADDLDKVIAEMETLRGDLKDGEEKLDEMADEEDEKYMNEFAAMVDEEAAKLGQEQNQPVMATEPEQKPDEIPVVEPPVVQAESPVSAPENSQDQPVSLDAFSPAPQQSESLPPLPPLPSAEQSAPMTPSPVEPVMGEQTAPGQQQADMSASVPASENPPSV